MNNNQPQSELESPKLRWRVLFYEGLGFVLLILWCWLDEIFDVPARLFGAAPSGVNIIEAVEETVVIAVFGVMVVATSFKLLSQIKVLEGIIPTCAFCKSIRVGEKWLMMEEYISKRSEAKFSHSFCPSCMEKHYGISEN